MKRILSALLMLALLLSLAACAASEQPTPPATTVAPTQPSAEAPTEAATQPSTEPEPTEPASEPGTLRATYGELVYKTFPQGTEVTVVGEFLDYYVITGEDADLLLDKCFVRLATEEAFAEKPGFAKWNAPVYDNPYLTGEPIKTLGSNFKVTVSEGKDGWLYITWDGGSGYAAPDQIRDRPASGGGGGGGGGDGSDVPMGSLSYREPGISLLGTYSGPEFTPMEETKAVTLIPEAKGYLAILNRDDTVKVVEAGEESCSIYYSGFYVTAPRWLVRLEGDEAYESWTGYTRYGSLLYSEYRMRNQLRQCGTNTQVKVIDELPGCYVVEIDGVVGYMKLDQVSKTRISGGGGGGGGGGEWTPPAM